MQTMEQFDIKKFQGVWYGIESNVSELKGMCYNSSDEFLVGSTAYIMTKTCISHDGKKTTSTWTISKYPGQPQQSRMVASRDGSKPMNYFVHDTDYTNYALVGNGDGKSFHVLSRKPQMELCMIGKVEETASRIGFDVSLIVREHKTIIPCAGASITKPRQQQPQALSHSDMLSLN